MNALKALLAGSLTCLLLAGGIAAAQTPAGACPPEGTYGNNMAASGRAKVSGISLYYESYGQGAPLLIIHGNGGSIDRMRCQIAFFSKTRRVIAADSRAHGHSDNGPAPLTEEQMADDLAALVRSLGIERIDVLGHSDGGIVALQLAIRHPDLVGKVVASGANLTPEVLPPATRANRRNLVQLANEKMQAGDRSQDWMRLKMQKEEAPHISMEDVGKISAPVLVMGGDHDVIPVSHFLDIATAIPHGQLAILPGANHNAHQNLYDLYNFIANRFFEVRFRSR